jgi:hypothetical protein
MCDEYVVIRMKSELLAPSLAPRKLSYGGDVVEEIGRGVIELKRTVVEAARGARVTQEAWAGVMRILYRSVFEPLSRNAGYCDEADEDFSLEQRLQAIKFYTEVVADHWHKIHGQLKRVFESDLNETEIALNEISGCIRVLLSTVGVTYRKTEDGQCWVDFNSAFLDFW